MFEYLSWLHHLHNMNVHKDPPKMYTGHSTVLVFLLLQHIQKLNRHIAFAYILRNQQANNIIFFRAYSCRCWVVLNDNVIECKHKQIIASFSYSTIAHLLSPCYCFNKNIYRSSRFSFSENTRNLSLILYWYWCLHASIIQYIKKTIWPNDYCISAAHKWKERSEIRDAFWRKSIVVKQLWVYPL